MSETQNAPCDVVEVEYPLWKTALKRLRTLPEFKHGLSLSIEWFEQALGCRRETDEFRFGMLALRDRVERENGFYLRQRTIQDDNGVRHKVFQIPAAPEHEDVSRGFESRMRNYATRSFMLREKTLANSDALAAMSESEIETMKKRSEIAATRIALLYREKSIANYLRTHAPKMLKRDTE